MGLLTNSLSTLVLAGSDAQSNLYEMVFDGGALTNEDDTQALHVRCTGFTPQIPTQDTYTVKYITAYTNRPVTKINYDNSFELEFRADDYWNVYKALLRQQKISMNSGKSFVNIDLNAMDTLLFNVRVNIVNAVNEGDSESTTRLFNYRGCWIEELKLSEWSYSNSEPMKVSAKIRFCYQDDWQSGLQSNESHEGDAHRNPMLNETQAITKYV